MEIKLLAALAVGSLLFGMSGAASATVLTFEDLPGDGSAISAGYGGFDWKTSSNIGRVGSTSAQRYPGSGYEVGTIGKISAYSAPNNYPTDITLAGPGTFTFNGAQFTSAWENQTLTFEGYKDGKLLYTSASYSITTTSPLWISLNWSGIDDLRIYGTAERDNWVVDNFTFNNTTAPEQTLLDASGDEFFVDASTGQLYSIDPSTHQRLPVEGVIVNDNAIIAASDSSKLGEILTDTSKTGESFSILGFQDEEGEGYLDFSTDIMNYRGITDVKNNVEKATPRFRLVGNTMVIKSYKALAGKVDWTSDKNIGIKNYQRTLYAGTHQRHFNFSVPTDGKYQILMYGFKYNHNDLDLEVVELSSGRILGASFSAIASESVTLDLKSGKTYGLAIHRETAINDVYYGLHLSKVVETAASKAYTSAGSAHVCATKLGDIVTCWGSIPRHNGVFDPQVRGITKVKQVASGEYHTCALKKDGTVICWGENDRGQLGDPDALDSAGPMVVPHVTDAISVAAGWSSSCAVRANGLVQCWGGDNRTPPTVVRTLKNVKSVVIGNGFKCALKSDGTVACWGTNRDGVLGNGTLDDALLPTPVPGLADVIQIAAGNRQMCAVKRDGTALCWGDNTSGQLGDGTFVNKSVPTPVATQSKIAAISAGENHTCALKRSKTVVCWGSNSSGELGDGSVGDASTSPVKVRDLADVVELTSGGGFNCARTLNQAMYCWGENWFYQSGVEHDGWGMENVLLPKRALTY